MVDVFQGKVLARRARTLNLALPEEETRLLFLGDADEFLHEMDYPGL